MRKRFLYFFVYLVLISLLLMPAYADSLIVPGKRIGPMKLDSSAAEVIRMFGMPEHQTSSSSTNYFIYYDKYKVVFGLSNNPRNVLDITVYAPFYKLENGIAVGSTYYDVEAMMGVGEVIRQRDGVILAYPRQGIAFALRGDEVFAISVRKQGSKLGVIIPR